MSVLVGFLMLVSCCADVECAPPPDEVPAPVVEAPDLPVGGALGRRIYCIEGYESQHGLYMYNRSSGASGYLQWLPSTARKWGVITGDRFSEWAGAARIAAQGESFFRSQWVPLQRGLC